MILAHAVLLLLIAFVVHLIWWRIRLPINPTRILLFIFTCTLIISVLYQLFLDPNNDWEVTEYVRLILLYTSCSLVYTILYSAIEQQSPTLAIITCLNQSGAQGCANDELLNRLSAKNEIAKRLTAMQQSNWIEQHGQRWRLTSKGISIARLFELSAAIIGLQRGG